MCTKADRYRLNRFLLLGAVALSIVVARGVAAQTISSHSLSPRLSCTPTTVTVGGTLPCANAVHDSTVVNADAFDIQVDVYFTQPLICLPAIIPYQVEADGPELGEVGFYSLNVRAFANAGQTDSAQSLIEIARGESCPTPIESRSWSAIKRLFE